MYVSQEKNTKGGVKYFRTKVALTGILGGFFGGLLGIGGSFLVIPLLSGPLKLIPQKAHASAIPVALVAGLSALGFYLSQARFDWSIIIEVIVGSLIGVLVGARLMRRVRGNKLGLSFGLFLCIIATLYAANIQSTVLQSRSSGPLQFFIQVALGLIAGLASGLFGAGGGTILVPGAVLLLHMGQQVAQGLSLMTIIPTTLLGTLVHYREGNLAVDVVPLLSISAFGSGILGGYLALVLHIVILRGLLVVALVYIGVLNIKRYWPKK